MNTFEGSADLPTAPNSSPAGQDTTVAPYEVLLSPELGYDYPLEPGSLELGEPGDLVQQPNTVINTAIISVLLCVGISTNVAALPVILFRRTKFGNGQVKQFLFQIILKNFLCF